MKTDQQLQIVVTAQLHGDPNLTETDMAATVAGEAVPLNGSAPRCAEPPDAERAAQRSGDLGATAGAMPDRPSSAPEASDTAIAPAVVALLACHDWVPNPLQAAIASGEATLISDVRGGPQQQAEVNAVHHLHGVQSAADRNDVETATDAPSVRTSIEAAFMLLVVLLFNM